MNKENIITGLFWKFSERIAAQLVTFIVSIVLARLIAPEEYGLVSLILVFIAFADVFVVNGFGIALIQKKNADDVDFSTVFFFNIAFSIFLYVILYAFSPIIANFYKMPELTTVTRIFSLRVVISGVNSVQHAFVSKNMLFKRYFWSTLLGTIVSGIIGIVMAYVGLGIWALVAQYLINSFVDTVVLWFTINWKPKLLFSFQRLKGLFSYGWKILGSALLDTFYSQSRNLIIGKVYQPEDLAYYNKGQQFPQLIVTNINTSISSVLFPAMSLEQDDVMRVKTMARRTIVVCSYVMWPLMIGLAVIAKPLVVFMLTKKWLFCVPYLQLACIVFGFYPINTANLEAIKALGRSDILLRLEIIKKIIGIAILIVTMFHSVWAIAVGNLVANLVGVIINAFPNQKLLKYSYKEQIRDMIPSLFLSGVMGAIIHLFTKVIHNDYILMGTQIVGGVAIYLVISVLFHFEGFTFIWDLCKKGYQRLKEIKKKRDI